MAKQRVSKLIRISNRTRDALLGEHIVVADTSIARLFGLIGRRGLASSEGLLIQPSNGVHTLGMRFSIDVLLLDRRSKVIASYDTLRPFRVTRLHWKAVSALELPAGTIVQTRTAIGDELAVENV